MVDDIAVFVELRDCAFVKQDFEDLFDLLREAGNLVLARFYNYENAGGELNRFVYDSGYELLPSLKNTNEIDTRLIIDALSYSRQDADAVLFVNVKDDETLIKALRTKGVKVYAAKSAAGKEILKLYDKIFLIGVRAERNAIIAEALKKDEGFVNVNHHDIIDEEIIGEFRRLLALE